MENLKVLLLVVEVPRASVTLAVILDRCCHGSRANDSVVDNGRRLADDARAPWGHLAAAPGK